MTIVVGIDPIGANHETVALASQLQRLMGADVLLATVRPPTMELPSRGNVDAEWTAYLHEQAQTALASATEELAQFSGALPVEPRIVVHASVSRGLRAVAAEVHATAIVIGPGSSSVVGRLALGSVAQSLLHSGETPVALAPGGYRAESSTITRLVVGFEPDPESQTVVASAVNLARAHMTPVDLLTLVVRVTRIAAPRLGTDPESAVLQAVTEQAMEAQTRLRHEYPAITRGAVEHGDTVQGAMEHFDWRDGDLFVLGSSADGILHRVFLGDTSHHILRAARVPTLVLPRGSHVGTAPMHG